MINDLTRPRPFPDEWSVGYAGRVARLNGLGSEKDLYDRLRVSSEHFAQGELVVRASELLAYVADMDVERFVSDHTLMPIWRGVVRKQSGPLVPSDSASYVLRASGMRPLRTQGWFCSCCAREDVDFHGQSYWRRDHQIPGRRACAKHGVGLTEVNLQIVFANSPFVCMLNSDIASTRSEPQDRPNPYIDRFLDICSHLLVNPRARDEMDVSSSVTALAKKQGYHAGRGAVRKPLVSDVIAEEFGKDFLDEALPGMSVKKMGEYSFAIDECLRERRSGQRTLVYVALAAVLAQNSDSAFMMIFESAPSERRRQRSAPKTLNLTTDQLRASYRANGGSHKLVGLQFGVEGDAVRSKLEAAGLPAIGRSSPKQLVAMVDLLLQGDRSINDICGKLKMPEERVRRMLEVVLNPFRDALSAFPHPTRHAGVASSRSTSVRPAPRDQTCSRDDDQKSDQKLVSVVTRSS